MKLQDDMIHVLTVEPKAVVPKNQNYQNDVLLSFIPVISFAIPTFNYHSIFNIFRIKHPPPLPTYSVPTN